MKTKHYDQCDACDIKVDTDKWEEHCETKKHVAFRKKSIYCKLFFDGLMGVRSPLLFTYIPKIPWRN